jgi:hypothetical protein
MGGIHGDQSGADASPVPCHGVSMDAGVSQGDGSPCGAVGTYPESKRSGFAAEAKMVSGRGWVAQPQRNQDKLPLAIALPAVDPKSANRSN